MPKIKEIEKLQAVGANVLIEVTKEKSETEAGLALPDSAKEKETVVMGKVVSIPELIKRMMDGKTSVEIMPEKMIKLYSLFLSEGDTVICKKFDYYLVSGDDDSIEYRMYDVDSIIGVIRK